MNSLFPNSCLGEIVGVLTPSMQATTALVSQRFASVARRELYREVELDESQTQQFFSTLASKAELGSLVHKIILAGSTYSCPQDVAEKAFRSLVNLWSLQIFHPVDFLPLPHFPGRLRDFLYAPEADEKVMDFLDSQPSIESIFFGDLGLLRSDSSFLPHLTAVSAPPDDLMVLVPSRPVKDVAFIYHHGDEALRPVVSLEFLSSSLVPVVAVELQISQLLAAADQTPGLDSLLPAVKQLVIYQDSTWGSAFTPGDGFGQSVNQMIQCINTLPTLRHVVVGSTYGTTQAQLIRRKFVHRCSVDLNYLVIGTADSILYWGGLSTRAKFLSQPLDAASIRHVNSLDY
ncbi:hypothetical protein R3P38DRAFT_3093833 [Favolaschia claudopus]|uniref:F-box domain-containing protein n=1 Tax=Favolaschia claudopus TaxID=2862362 RepID=A0AAV9ZQM1_9AGAR